jgi:cation transport protein ChaC
MIVKPQHAKAGSRIWVFGYGSLMWDGWETQQGCTRRAFVVLPGYRRAFNKASVRNWGTKANPCPTLNLIASPFGACRGIAFEFPADRAGDVRACLGEREGQGFTFQSLSIRLDDGSGVEALVPIYDGKNILAIKDTAELVAMIARAKGAYGSGAQYVRGVAHEACQGRH